MKKVFLLLAFFAAFAFKTFAGESTNYRTALVLAYSPANNVYEDDNIRLEIFNEKLYALNKTNRTVFIDLSQCFAVHNGTSYPMFEEHKDEKHASKRKDSTSIDQFISIAPATGNKQNDTFICNLAGGIYGKYSTTESPSGNFSEYEERLLSLIDEMSNESLSADPKGKQYLGTSHRHLTEDESVNNIGANIAYAFNKRAEDWIPVAISTWVSDIYFAPYYVEMPKDLGKKQQKGFGVKKTESAKLHLKADSPFEFDSDRSPVIVADWTGNFKKGEFTLQPTWVIKQKGSVFGKTFGNALTTLITGAPTPYLINNEETVYKKSILFDGASQNWPGMKYMRLFDLSSFNNK